MSSLGDFDPSAVVYGKFTTFRPSTGAPFTLAGTPALSVYKDNSTTQSTTGVTLTVDFDAVTGLNHFAIDTSADGAFYASGSFFDVVITTGTVDSVSSVGAKVASFTIRKNSSLKPVTSGRTLVVDAAGLADANTVKVGPTGTGTAQTARDLGASVLLSPGTGTGQISLTSGAVTVGTNSDKTGYSLSVTPPTSAQIATSVWQDATAGDFTVASSIGRSLYTTGNLPGAASGLAIVGSNVGTATSVSGSVGSIASNGITRASFAADTGMQTVRSNTAQSGGATTITLDVSASSVTDFYKNDLIYLTGGTGSGQARFCTAYNGTTKVATVTAWSINPDATTTFAVVKFDAIAVSAPTAAAIRVEMDTNSTQLAKLGTPAGASMSADIAAVNAKTTNLPASPASTTNISGGTITTVTNLTNLPSIPTNWLTAAGISAGALNNKGNWSISGDAMTLTPLAQSDLATAILDLANGVESGITMRQALRAVCAGIFGQVTGGGSGVETFKALGDPATTRAVVTVTSVGNRTNVALTL